MIIGLVVSSLCLITLLIPVIVEALGNRRNDEE